MRSKGMAQPSFPSQSWLPAATGKHVSMCTETHPGDAPARLKFCSQVLVGGDR